ncbi:MAG: hypothetical protein P1U56_19860 [Saprospiraceae bacterium]|nr:hypothetical protein [Saprospiraceae bacterium]
MENKLDNLFKSKLGGQEPEFNPAAWDRMEGLLNEEGMVPLEEKETGSRRKYFFLLVVFGILIFSLGYFTKDSMQDLSKGSAQIDLVDKVESENLNQTRGLSKNNKASIQKDPAIKVDLPVNKGVESIIESETTTISEHDIIIHNTSSESTQFNSRDRSTLNEHGQSSLTDENNLNSEMQENTILVEDRIERAGSNEIIVATNDQSQSDHDPANSNSNILTNELVHQEKETEPNELIDLDRNEENNKISENKIPLTDSRLAIIDVNTLPKKSTLLKKERLILLPEVQTTTSNIFEIGLSAMVRPNKGLGVVVGPSFRVNILKGYSVQLGVEYGLQNFDEGPELSVFDKVYSFGSTITERKFVLNKRRSIRIPFLVKKSISNFGITGGVIYNQNFAFDGSIMNGGEVQENTVSNELLKTSSLAFQVGASVALSRYFELSLGVEYTPASFHSEFSGSNAMPHYYPTLGINYKLFKF